MVIPQGAEIATISCLELIKRQSSPRLLSFLLTCLRFTSTMEVERETDILVGYVFPGSRARGRDASLQQRHQLHRAGGHARARSLAAAPDSGNAAYGSSLPNRLRAPLAVFVRRQNIPTPCAHRDGKHNVHPPAEPEHFH